MKKCWIVGAGECKTLPPPDKDTFIIAADGGYDNLKKHGISPSLLVGDLDSIENVPENIEILRYRVKKDETDMHLAYLEGVRRGYRDFAIFGGLGGRLDHSLANLSLLAFIANDGSCAKLIGEHETLLIIKNSTVELCGKYGTYFSVFAFGGEARGVTIKRAEYEAEEITLSPDFPLGVSNKFLDAPAEISVSEGMLLIALSDRTE